MISACALGRGETRTETGDEDLAVAVGELR